MAVSGTKTWDLQVDELIQEALERVGGDWTSAEEQRSARRSLNLLFTDIQNRGATLAHIQKQVVTVSPSVVEYTLPTSVAAVLDAVVRTSGVDVPLDRVGIFEYNQINNKMTPTGRPTQYTTERRRDNVTMFIYPCPTSVERTIEYYSIVYPDTVTNSRQNVDFNRRFFPALVAGLAWEMSKKRNGFSPERVELLKADYMEFLQNAFLEDRERSSIHIRPKIREW